MKKLMKSQLLFLSLIIFVIPNVSCSKKDDDTNATSATASQYADFGSTLSKALPNGLKSGASGSSAKSNDRTELALQSGSCNDNYTGCPTISESGGGDSQTGEIIMKIWAMDYDNVCSAASGTCFNCPDCNDRWNLVS